MELVYHYTDTGGLPWILQSGELRPGKNLIGGFPNPDFLWATTDSRGDRSASGMAPATAQFYRNGEIRHVRFTLAAADFEMWPDVTAKFPEWTPEQIERLESAAANRGDAGRWRCRTEPLSQSQWVSIETRSYANNKWKPLSASIPLIATSQSAGEWLGVTIGGVTYFSMRTEDPNTGLQGFRIGRKLAA